MRLPKRDMTTTAVVLSPLALIGVVVLAAATGHDLIFSIGEAPVAAGLCAPAAFLSLRWVAARLEVRL